MKTLAIEPLTKEAFAAFGDVIELEGAKQIPINLGTTIRYHDLAKVDVTDENGRTLVNLFRGQPRVLPFEVKMLERHPLGSQAFVPLNDKPYLVVVAPAGELDPSADSCVRDERLAGCELREGCLASSADRTWRGERFHRRRSWWRWAQSQRAGSCRVALADRGCVECGDGLI